MPNSIKTLYDFTVFTEREVDETTSRQEGDKTVTETVKVKKRTPHMFAFQKPSRAQRELADEEHAVWWTRYVERGIMPEAQLIKTYNNYGGVFSEEEKHSLKTLEATLLLRLDDLRRAQIQEKDDLPKLRALAEEVVDLRTRIIDFRQARDVFYSNTAEAKAKAKLIEYLVLHFSWHREDETKDWQQFFAGNTTDEKNASRDKLEEAADELFSLARDRLVFVATIYATAQGNLNKGDIEAFEQSLVKDEVAEPAAT